MRVGVRRDGLARLTRQSVALRLILVPLTVEIQRAALAVGQLAAHLLVAHRTLGEVLYVLQQEGERSDGGKHRQEVKKLLRVNAECF